MEVWELLTQRTVDSRLSVGQKETLHRIRPTLLVQNELFGREHCFDFFRF